MPFNPSTNRLDALWNFVDQFQAGDDAARSDFDTAFQDVRAGINDMAAYLEGLLNVDGLTDQRYLGRSATAPTLRANGDNLFIGDFYSTSDALGRTNLFYVWDGVAFVPASDFAAITGFFRNLAAVEDAATMRGILELGSAAVQNATAFAPSSLTGAIELFLSLAPNGLAKTVTDWSAAHLTGPGCGFFAGDAAAIGGPAVLNTVAVYLAYDANSGLMIAGTPSTGAVYFRSRLANVWASGWTETPSLTRTRGDLIIGGASAWARLPVGTPGQTLVSNGVDPLWQSPQIMIVADQKTISTNGGTFVSPGFQRRDLNTVRLNNIVGASLAANQITLPAGTYLVEAAVPALRVNSHIARLQNVSDSTTALTGTSEVTEQAGAIVSNKSLILGSFTISAPKTFEVQHACTIGFVTSGFGQASGLAAETYTTVVIRKL